MKTIAMATSLLLIVGFGAAELAAQEEAIEPVAETAGDVEEMEGLEERAPSDEQGEVAQAGDESVSETEEAVVLMSARWAELACEAWNANPTLTEKLAAPGWVANNKGRGIKVIQLYRTDCEQSPWVELQISDEGSKARCSYGGPLVTEQLERGVDYVMHAKTERWQEMGAGGYGPMKGMMTGRLKFKGPKWEAMKNMGPFSSFLLLVGEVESDAGTCPAEADA